MSNCNYNLYVEVKKGKYQTKGFVFTHWWIPNKRTWTILSGCFISCFLPKEYVKEIRLRSLIFECREWDQLPSEFILRDLEDGTSNLYQINISIEIEMNPVSIYQYFMTTSAYSNMRYFILIQFHRAATLYISFFQSIAQNLQEFAANMTCNCQPLHIQRISIAIVCAKSLLY